MSNSYYSNGKLLLSGEYAILDGALGWAVPTRYGQTLRWQPNESGMLRWTGLDHNGVPWLEASLKLDSFEPKSAKTTEEQTLGRIFKAVRELNPDFLKNAKGLQVRTNLDFPKDWGLGSSSTLINNIANWGGVDPYTLLQMTFGGSGYDIACAQHNKPISFQLKNGKPVVTEQTRCIPFEASLYFVYLNQKQNSRQAIATYRQRERNPQLIATVTQLTDRMMQATGITEFEHLMLRHEAVLSEALDIVTVQERLFPDYEGTIKSLGAWGGDFVMATGNDSSLDYFKEKGYDVIIPFSQMVV